MDNKGNIITVGKIPFTNQLFLPHLFIRDTDNSKSKLYRNNDNLTKGLQIYEWERSGSVVECLTRDRRAAGSSLTGVTALCP